MFSVEGQEAQAERVSTGGQQSVTISVCVCDECIRHASLGCECFKHNCT